MTAKLSILVLLAVLAWQWPRAGESLERRAIAAWRRLPDPRRGPFLLGAALLALLGVAALDAALGVPRPMVHDEFSYLLSADTFAHGRLNNPPHPFPDSFETFHVLQRPTYASKYPPGQGLLLAAGQVGFGHPVVGVWMSAVLAVLALHWMLLAWLPARWAALGTLLFLLEIGLTSYWSHSYWGGHLAAAGGALAFGAAQRLTARPRGRDGLLFGVGAVVLANTRPYEGLVAIVLAAGHAAYGWFRQDSRVRGRIARAVAAAALVVALGAV